MEFETVANFKAISLLKVDSFSESKKAESFSSNSEMRNSSQMRS